MGRDTPPAPRRAPATGPHSTTSPPGHARGPPPPPPRPAAPRSSACHRRPRPLGSPRELPAYVVPPDAGVATVACLAPAGGRAMPARACQDIASTLRLRRARPYPLGPSDAYAAALTSAVGSLRQGVAT